MFVIHNTVSIIPVAREVVNEPLTAVVVYLGEHRRQGLGAGLQGERYVVSGLSMPHNQSLK